MTMGFFEDIVVPPTEMQPDTHFDAKEQLWVWKYGDAELFMEIDEVTARAHVAALHVVLISRVCFCVSCR